MKITSKHGSPSRGFAQIVAAIIPSLIATLWISECAHAQIYVGQQNSGRVGEYDVITGAAINANLITGFNTPYGLDFLGNNLFASSNLGNRVGEYNATTGAVIAANFVTQSGPSAVMVSGNNLFVAYNFGGVSEYNATTGATISGSFITGLQVPGELEISGNSLFVSDQGANRVGLYNATTGAAINANFISLSSPWGLALSGNNLFVSQSNGTVGLFNASTGASINPSFLTGLNSPLGLAVSGNNLFVANFASGTVGEYNATTGAAINPSFITGLNGPVSIAVRPVPEPSTWLMLGCGAGWLGFRRAERSTTRKS